jgi:hypothetical protein
VPTISGKVLACPLYFVGGTEHEATARRKRLILLSVGFKKKKKKRGGFHALSRELNIIENNKGK